MDSHSFWVYGYFEETKLPRVKIGDKAEIRLMSGGVLQGHVESISRGIYDRDNPQSRELLAVLFEHMTEPRFIYRHRWQPHDLVFWDNRATVHLATGCPPHLRRTLYRTTVRGDRPKALLAGQISG